VNVVQMSIQDQRQNPSTEHQCTVIVEERKNIEKVLKKEGYIIDDDEPVEILVQKWMDDEQGFGKLQTVQPEAVPDGDYNYSHILIRRKCRARTAV